MLDDASRNSICSHSSGVSRNGVNGGSTISSLVNPRERNYSTNNISWRPAQGRSISSLRILSILFGVLWGWIAFVSVQKLNLISNDEDGNKIRHRRQQETLLKLQPHQPFHMNPQFPCKVTENTMSLEDHRDNNHPPPMHRKGAHGIFHGVFTPFSMGPRQHPSDVLYNTSQTKELHRSLLFDRARFRLFQTFCADSMRYQTSANTYWIIVVDEHVEPDVMNDLIMLLYEFPQGGGRDTPFLVAVPSEAIRPPGSLISFGWYDMIREYRNGNLNIATGDNGTLVQALERIEYLKSLSSEQQRESMNRQQWHILLETRLDVDFGLHKNGIEWIQDFVLQQYQGQYPRTQPWSLDRSNETNIPWWYLCGTEHLEWHNPDIFFLHKFLFTDTGLSTGRTGLRVRPHMCALGGLTRVGVLGRFIPFNGTYIANVIPDLSTNETVDMYSFLETLPRCVHGLPSDRASTPAVLDNCLVRAFSETPIAIQARDGLAMDGNGQMSPDDIRAMKGINEELDGPLLLNRAELTWDLLKRDFNIHRYTVWEMSVFLYEHIADILLGHPCAMAETTNNNTTNAITSSTACNGWDHKTLNWMLEEVTKRGLEPSKLFKASLFNQQKTVAAARKANETGRPRQKTAVKEPIHNRERPRRVSAPRKE